MVDLSIRPVRRVVTGHDAAGRSVASFAGPAPSVHPFAAWPGGAMTEIWATHETPAAVDGEADLSLRPTQLLPPANGSVFRIAQIPPVSVSTVRGTEQFAELGAPQAHTGGDGRNAGMHRTATIDYGIVLSGEVYMILDDEEILLKAGDCVVQRGADHGWENRSDEIAMMAFVLIDALPAGAARQTE